MKDLIIRVKIYFDRSAQYQGYVNFLVLALVFFESYKETNFGIWFYANKTYTLPAFIVIYFIIRVFVGWFHKRFIWPDEARITQKVNPLFMEMYKKVNEMYNKMKKDDN